jgi:hypothetical protein
VVAAIDETIHDGVPHRTVLVLVVDLGAQGPLAALFAASQELAEARQVLLDGGVAVLGRNLGTTLLFDLYT